MKALALSRRIIRTTCAFVLCLLTASPLAGCDELGTALYLIEGPPMKEAVFELDARRSTVVLVDARGSSVPTRSTLKTIGESVDSVLLEKRLLRDGNLIESRAALNAIQGDTRSSLTSIVDVGRAVGADIIIYAHIVRFTLYRDGQAAWPAATVELKIFDCEANTRLFPESGAYEITVPVGREPETAQELTRADIAEMQLLLARRTGYEIARSFFKTEADTRVAPPLRGR